MKKNKIYFILLCVYSFNISPVFASTRPLAAIIGDRLKVMADLGKQDLHSITKSSREASVLPGKLYETFEIPLPIAIHDYAKRIVDYGNSYPHTHILAMYYLEKLHQTEPLYFRENTLHKLYGTAFGVARKFHEDLGHPSIPVPNIGVLKSNDYHAYLVGVGRLEINQMENDFLKMMKYNAFVSREEFERYQKHLLKHPTQKFVIPIIQSPSLSTRTTGPLQKVEDPIARSNIDVERMLGNMGLGSPQKSPSSVNVSPQVRLHRYRPKVYPLQGQSPSQRDVFSSVGPTRQNPKRGREDVNRVGPPLLRSVIPGKGVVTTLDSPPHKKPRN